jgi:hypothetical protein
VRVDSAGTDNAIYRVGDDVAVRLLAGIARHSIDEVLADHA